MNRRTLPASLVLISACLLFGLASANATDLTTWDKSPDYGETAGAQSIQEGLSDFSGMLTRGSGMQATPFNSNGEIVISGSGVNVSSLDSDRYFEFSISPDYGHSMDLDEFSFEIRTTDANALWTVRSSLDNFSANLITPTSGSTGTAIDVTLGSSFDDLSEKVTFRIYAWNTTTANKVVGILANSTMALAGDLTHHQLISWAASSDKGEAPGVPSLITTSGIDTSASPGVLSRGSGMNATSFGNGGAIIAGDSADTVDLDTDCYFEISIAPDSGYFLTLSELALEIRTASDQAYWMVRSSMDNYQTNLIEPVTGPTGTVVRVPLYGQVYDSDIAVTLRIYVWNASTANKDVGILGSMYLYGTATDTTDWIDLDADYHVIGDGTSHTIEEWLVGNANDRGYANLGAIQTAYSSLNASLSTPLTLDDQIDFVEISQCILDASEGDTVRFGPSKTYVINRPIDTGKIINGIMSGATIKVADELPSGSYSGPYNIFKMEPTSGRYAEFSWIGGFFDGNNENVDWPGSTTIGNIHDSDFELISEGGDPDVSNDEWGYRNVYGNNGLLGVRYVELATFDGVSVINSIGDGLVAFNCTDAFMVDCIASNGAPLNFTEVKNKYDNKGRQSTFFKARHTTNDTTFETGSIYVINPLIYDGGSIGIALSCGPEDVVEDSYIHIEGGFIHDMSQDGIHIESSEFIYIGNLVMTAEEGEGYNGEIHMSNHTKEALIENTTLTNGVLDFRNASSLRYGEVIGCTIINVDIPTKPAIKNATHVEDTVVESVSDGIDFHPGDDNTRISLNNEVYKWTGSAIVQAREVIDCILDNANVDEGTGIKSSTADDFYVENTEILNVKYGIVINSGITDAEIRDTNIENTQGSAITVGNIDSLLVDSGSFFDIGLDTSLANDRRVAIGGNGGAAPSDSLTITNSNFDATDVNAYTNSIYILDSSVSPTITETGNTIDW